MTIVYIEDFATFKAAWVASGTGAGWSVNSARLRASDSAGAVPVAVKLDLQPDLSVIDTINTVLEMTFTVNFNGATDQGLGKHLGMTLTFGGTEIKFRINVAEGDSSNNGAVRVHEVGGSTYQATGLDVESGGWHWMKVRLSPHGLKKFVVVSYALKGAQGTLPTSWTEAFSFITTDSINDTEISKVEADLEYLDGIDGNAYQYHIDNLTITVGFPSLGGSATIGEKSTIMARTKIGAGSAATLIEHYDSDTDLITIKDNLNKSVLIESITYEKIVSKYEIKSINIDRENNLALYTMEEAVRKLLKTRTGLVTLSASTYVHKVWNDFIFNFSEGWTTNQFVDFIISFTDENFYVNTIVPISTSYDVWSDIGNIWLGIDPDLIESTVDEASFEDPVTPTALGISTENEAISNNNKVRIEALFNIWSKDDVEWDDINLNIQVRFTSLASSKVDGIGIAVNYPSLWIWNYNTSAWQKFHQYSKDDADDNLEASETWVNAAIEAADGGGGKSPIFDSKFDLLVELGVSKSTFKANYMDVPGAANASNFKESFIQIAVQSPQVASIIGMDPKIEIHFLAVEFSEEVTKTTSQVQEQGFGKVLSNTPNKIVVDDTALGILDYPAGDGVTIGDILKISANLELQLAEFFTNHPIFSLVTNFNGDYTTYTDASDILNMMAAAWFDKLSATHNFFWLYNPTLTTDPVEFHDNIVSTGITLTSADMLTDFPIEITYDTYQMHEVIRVNGAEGLTTFVNDGAEYNVEYENTLGDTEIIYNESTLISQRNISAYATSKIQLHEKESIHLVFPISISNPSQNYLAIEKGKSVVVDTSVLPSEAGSITLIIDDMVYHKSVDNRERFDLILKRRNI